MSDATELLAKIESGDLRAAEDLLPLVYEELRILAAAKLAHEKPGQTLQATALVHEAHLRLVGNKQNDIWDGRGHFFAAAAEAMRRILINRARDRKRVKRGGGQHRIDFENVELALGTQEEDLLDLDEAIDDLESVDEIGARLVKLRFFAGLTLGEAAHSTGIARRTADRHWAFARAWLYDRLGGNED